MTAGHQQTATKAPPAGRYWSPLRYPGGKGKVANYIKLILLENNLLDIEYVEPYAGGASVALALLFEDYASHVHINDFDRSVWAFWAAVLHHTDELCSRIRDTAVTVDEWHRQRAIQRDPDTPVLDLGFSTFFLNRTNRSGIVTGGIIGGQNQDGGWALDARYKHDHLIRRVQKVARFRSRITLTMLDAAALLDAWTDSATPAIVYLDPPYFHHSERLYRNTYEPEDHAAIAERVRKLPVPWVVSYDAADEVAQLYAGQRTVRYSLHYSAAARQQGSEVMFFSSDLTVPDIASPAGVRLRDLDRARRRLLMSM